MNSVSAIFFLFLEFIAISKQMSEFYRELYNCEINAVKVFERLCTKNVAANAMYFLVLKTNRNKMRHNPIGLCKFHVIF